MAWVRGQRQQWNKYSKSDFNVVEHSAVVSRNHTNWLTFTRNSFYNTLYRSWSCSEQREAINKTKKIWSEKRVAVAQTCAAGHQHQHPLCLLSDRKKNGNFTNHWIRMLSAKLNEANVLSARKNCWPQLPRYHFASVRGTVARHRATHRKSEKIELKLYFSVNAKTWMEWASKKGESNNDK